MSAETAQHVCEHPDDPAELVEILRSRLTPAEDANPLLPLVETGRAPVSVIGELAAQQRRVIASDRRSFLFLAGRAADTPAGHWFAELAAGEARALELLPALGAACGLPDDIALFSRSPLAGCQAYPAYQAWLALNGHPASTALALTANFSAWGGYCARLSRALREQYGFSAEACGFFDLFAEPAPEEPAFAAIDGADCGLALEYGGLLQSYERLFWETLAQVRR